MTNSAAELVHHRSCNLCEAMCGLEIRVRDGEVVSIRGDENDPFSRGHICPKAVALQDIHGDPDRLRHPVKKTEHGGWQRISWEQAFELVEAGIRRVQAHHGRDAVAIYGGNPNVHNYGSLLYGPPLIHALRTRHRYSATSVDQLPHHFSSYFLYGHILLLPVPDLDRTQFFLCLGGNPAVSNGSLMTAPDVKKRLGAIQERGGRVVVVDPRRTETANLAGGHVFIRPGTDAWFLFSLLHVIFQEGLDQPGRLAAFTDGIGVMRELATEFDPETTSKITGVSADAVRQLTRDFCAADSAVCYGRMGVSTQEFGGLCQWLINVINVVTGNLDRPGGAMFTRPAVDVVKLKKKPGSFRRWTSHVRELPEFGGELPVSSLAEDMEAGAVRALVTSAGNPVLSTPDGRRLDLALADAEFVVSIDFYINETTRHADVILPPTASLEHDHYDLIFHALAIRDTARYSEPLFTPADDTRHDWQILLELQKRLVTKPTFAQRSWWAVASRGPHVLLDLALRSGPYGSGLRSFLPFGKGLSLERLKRYPHGIDLGALKPSLPDRLQTPDRRIHLAPAELVEDVSRLRQRADGMAAQWQNRAGRLTLIGRRQVRSNNSWMHNYPRLMKGSDRCTLLMHPDDAVARSLSDGDHVRVSSRVGEIEVPLEISDEMMPGVVSMPHGFGHAREGVRLTTASGRPGASVNDLNDSRRIDDLTGNAAFSGLSVTVVARPKGRPAAKSAAASVEASA
ncbi:MAG: molybdopterin oxidoreductase family protein [Thermoanaerobaculia bacterium]|nr:molybdopterin oxidoreductase family protein [Thermoanaerobaculia bacterium]